MWNLGPMLRDDHRLHTSGAYAVTRHPISGGCRSSFPGWAPQFVGMRQGILQVPIRDDVMGSRPPRTPPGGLRALQAQVELVLARDQALARDGPQDLQLGLIMGRPDVLDVP